MVSTGETVGDTVKRMRIARLGRVVRMNMTGREAELLSIGEQGEGSICISREIGRRIPERTIPLRWVTTPARITPHVHEQGSRESAITGNESEAAIQHVEISATQNTPSNEIMVRNHAGRLEIRLKHV